MGLEGKDSHTCERQWVWLVRGMTSIPLRIISARRNALSRFLRSSRLLDCRCVVSVGTGELRRKGVPY
jgi:hypothetical protein